MGYKLSRLLSFLLYSALYDNKWLPLKENTKNNPRISSYADGVKIPVGVHHITANYMNAKKADTENVTEIIVQTDKS